jgi:hypothetical protein
MGWHYDTRPPGGISEKLEIKNVIKPKIVDPPAIFFPRKYLPPSLAGI